MMTDATTHMFSSTSLSIICLFTSIIFLVGVILSMKIGRHHHCLMLMTALGLTGATLAQGLGREVHDPYPGFIHILYHVCLDGLSSPALAGTSMTRLFICLHTSRDLSTAKVYQIFSLTLVLLVGTVRLCIQSTTLGLEHHHRSTVLFCDGLIAFWDFGCCLLVLCAYLTRNLSQATAFEDECSHCHNNNDSTNKDDINNHDKHNPCLNDGYLISNFTSVLIRIALVVVSASNGNTFWSLILLGLVIPSIVVFDLRKTTIQLLQRICCAWPRRQRLISRSGFNSEEFLTRCTDAASVVLELSDLDQPSSTSLHLPESSTRPNDDELFLIPRSRSEHSGVLANQKHGIANLCSKSGSEGPTRSCSCGSFTGKSKSGGPLDQILSQVVGSKQLDTIRDEKIEDDRQQMDKLKASLSIQAICSNFAHHEKSLI